MGFLTKLKENKQASNLASPAQWLIEMFNPNSTSGVTVTEEKAMEHTAVYAAVRIIAETIASLPLHVYTEQDGERKKAKDNYLYKILKRKPNNLMTSFTWREVMLAHLLLWGNHYSKLDLSNDGKIKAIWPLMPGQMQVKKRDDRIYYKYSPADASPQMFEQNEIMHIPGLGFNGIVGKSVIKMARESVGLGLAAEEFGSRFFSQGAQPGGIVEYPGKLSDDAYDRYKKDMRDQYSGLSKSHKLMVLEEGLKYHQTGIPPDDAQFLETRRFQVEEIARIFRVPPHMLADLDRATFSNIEQQSINFVVNTIRPWLVRIEQVLNDSLLSDRNNKNYIKFVVEGLLRGDAESRASFYNQMFNIGAMSINEIRDKEELNPIDNGDQSFVPLNMLPLSSAAQEMVEEDEPEPEPEPEENSRELRQLIHKRSAATRRRIRSRYESKIRSAADNVVTREVNFVRDVMNKELKSQQAFRDKIVAFYDDYPEEVMDEMRPVIYSLADAIAEEAAAEVDLDDVDVEEFKREYLESMSGTHAGYSRGQLLALMNDADDMEEAAELIEGRLDEWDEKKAGKIGMEQSVKVESAIAREVFVSAGITKYIWMTDGDPCPICAELEGAVVGVDEYFLDEDETIQQEGGFSASGPKLHAPLHEGCMCTVSPA